MYSLILKLAWPYLQRYLAQKTAGYLQDRRTRRLKETVEEKVEEVVSDYLPPAEIVTDAPRFAANTVWFSLAGLLLGGAFGLIVYLLYKD
jgi:hypothetical protein